MKVELIYAPGCERCAAARAGLKAATEKTVPDVRWREVNVLEEIHYAVELGVLTLPALAIDGTLVFASLPAPQVLAEELARRLVQATTHGS
jgi:thioredoxin 1